jgi:hypothetical protein
MHHHRHHSLYFKSRITKFCIPKLTTPIPKSNPQAKHHATEARNREWEYGQERRDEAQKELENLKAKLAADSAKELAEVRMELEELKAKLAADSAKELAEVRREV